MTEVSVRPGAPSPLARRWRARARTADAEAGGAGIARRPAGQGAPLSFAQERMWFLEQYAPGTATYHMWLPLRVHGPLDEPALVAALDALVARHDGLRMRFPAGPDGEPTVEIDPPRIPYTHLDLSGDADPPVAARAALERDLARPFDLATGPLLRAALVCIAPDDHVVCLTMHHIVSDGWSTEVILDEWGALYDAARAGQPAALPALPIDYGDYARWQREQLAGGHAERDLSYWRERLAGIPALVAPTDRPYPETQTTHGASYVFRVGAGLAASLGALGQAHGATLFMTLLAGYQALLSWWAGQDDFGVGVPVAGRHRPETEGLVGLFVNTLVMRADLSGDPSFAGLLARVREAAIDAFSHQELPFERVVNELKVARDVRRPPVFQVSFAMQNYAKGPATPRGSLRFTPFPVDNPTTRHELALYVHHEGDELVGTVTYNTDLFDAATIARLFDRFTTLLRQVSADPAAPLSHLDLLSAEEHALLRQFSGTDDHADGADADAVLTDPFDVWVARSPQAPAVVHGADALTYAELDRLANRLARRLHALGVGPESRVGICLEQSTGLAVAVLAVLKAGGAYLPLDPEQPPARLAYLLADAQAEVVITEPALAGLLPAAPPRLLVDESGADRDPDGYAPPPPAPGPDNLAYVIYTSGSTGQPKGVAVAHRQVLHYLDGIRSRLCIVDGARYGLLQSLSFDFAVTMFYLALSTGGCVHLIPRRASGRELADHLAAAEIDYLKLTPSHLAALAAEVPARDLLPRRALILGGEASRADWTRDLARLSGAAVVNHYGPTEATVGVTAYQVPADRGSGSVTTPIGRPLPYARIHLLDRLRRPVPVGAVGEIFIGGDRLARGYLGRPELTEERFVPDPAGPPGARLYRTGDLGRWLPGGDLEFLGRRDNQVKLRGYRIELGEIEAALTGLPEVNAAVVVVHAERLVAYLEPAEPGTRVDISELRRRLGQTLPEYLLPARAIWLDRLPLMAHGKVDRAALPAPGDERPEQAAGYVAPDGPLQQAIAEVWRAVLGVDRVGADDDFFDLGGHSLLATQVISRLRRALPDHARPVTVMDLFKHPTVRGLAALAGDAERAPTGLLHELTAPVDPAGRSLSLVCVPYGGASAIVYQPLADALPAGVSLYSVAVPGHDIGVQAQARPFAEVAEEVTAEVLRRVDGPLALYGHCGPGAALTVEVARRLEAAGRPLAAVYLGGVFPFARPTGMLGRLSTLVRLDRLRSDTVYSNWLQSMGADVGALEPAQRRYLIQAMRRDAQDAEDYFTELLSGQVTPLRAPIVSVVGERDPGTDFYAERYREWGFLAPRTALVVLDEAGHYFLKYRAAELADIVTGVHPALDTDDGRALRRTDRPAATWWLHDTAAAPAASAPAEAAARPGMGRFLAVAAGQLVSMTGTALTEFAIPIWEYVRTDSLLRFALFAVVAVLPGILVAPLAGALVDRADRRRVLIAANLAAGGLPALLAVLLATGQLATPVLYAALAALSVTLTLQRLAYTSAVPQLVPKQYLGHANGVVQFATGAALFVVPLSAVALLHSVGMLGILIIDVASYAACLAVLFAVRFPRAMAWRRRESVLAEIRNGYRYFFDRPGLRAMLLFFVGLNAPLAAVLVLVSPLVLAVGTLGDAGRVAMISAGGAILGGLAMALWGGPKRQRMRTMLWAAAGLAASAAVTGLRPSLPLIAAGVFCLSFALSLVNGVWMTIIHTKVPQRFHARVIALNQMVALSVLSLGFAVAPLASEALQPLLAPGGALAGSVGALIGVGDGRGIGLLYVLCGAAMGMLVAVSLRRPVLAGFDRDVPDAEPDDLVGLAALRSRSEAGR